MTVRIAPEPFATQEEFNSEIFWIGPAWFTIFEDHIHYDVNVDHGIEKFIQSAISLTKPGEFSYGTVYAARLDGAGRNAGAWHYDLGEYTHEGTRRFVSTWRSDGREIGNIFSLPHGELLSAPNLYVTSFHEGSDLHCHPGVPATPGERGLFLSASMYAIDEPANLDCPRLEALRYRGPYAKLARRHATVKREVY